MARGSPLQWYTFSGCAMLMKGCVRPGIHYHLGRTALRLLHSRLPRQKIISGIWLTYLSTCSGWWYASSTPLQSVGDNRLRPPTPQKLNPCFLITWFNLFRFFNNLFLPFVWWGHPCKEIFLYSNMSGSGQVPNPIHSRQRPYNQRNCKQAWSATLLNPDHLK